MKLKIFCRCSLFPSWQTKDLSAHLYNGGKCGTARHATHDDTVRRMRSACWITKVTDTHSEYVTLLIVFPLQQWLRERASLLRYTYITCLV